MNFKSVQGSVQVNIYLEQRDGNVVVAKTFTVTGTGSSGTSGIGTDGFGLALFGASTNVPELITSEQPRKSFIYKSARTFQVEVRTTNKTDTYELLGIKGISILKPEEIHLRVGIHNNLNYYFRVNFISIL